jgi:aryl-alcohol dehydrogenase-like predicted oxidoreductase
LGRTKQNVSLIGFGTAPLGSDNTTPDDADRILRAALGMGINYFDTAPVYGDPKSKFGNAEMKMKSFLASHRKDVFLVTKVNAERPDRDGVLRQLEESLKRLGVDCVDAVHIHNLGDFDMKQTLGRDGALAGLREARKREWTRWIGTSGHMRPARFVEAIQTGDIDLTMNSLNFADRENYDFEGLVIPAAKKQGTAVVAMKVLGGAVKWVYDAKTPACFADRHEAAIRYALGLPGVCSAVIGFSNVDEVRKAVEVARGYKPLDAEARTDLLTHGRRLAAERGLYYGPVTG